MSFVFWVGLTGLALLGIAVFTGNVTLPWQINVQREAVQHSNPYVQSRVTELSAGVAQYARLETQAAKYAENAPVAVATRAQQAALVNRMWIAYDLIPPDIRGEVVPEYIRAFLAKHPRGGE